MTVDKHGVRHIEAHTLAEAYEGFGYYAATDRLFQLEMQRREATGQVAEVLGVEHLAQDMRARRDHDAASLRVQWDRLSPGDQALLLAYRRGLNTRIAEVLQGDLPEDFASVWGQDAPFEALLKVWTLEDLLATAAWVLCLDARHSHALQNLDLLERLKRHEPRTAMAVFDTLLWEEDVYAPTTKQAHGNLLTMRPEQPVPRRLPPFPVQCTWFAEGNAMALPRDDRGGMAILVGRSKTADGNALHFLSTHPGRQTPPHFYAIGLHVPHARFHVVGHAPGAMPAMTLGENGTIAWSASPAGGDHTVVYEEVVEVDGEEVTYTRSAESAAAQTRVRKQKARARASLIKVKGQADVRITSYFTHRGGAFITDPIEAARQGRCAYSQAVAWKGSELASVVAVMRMATVRSWSAFQRNCKHISPGCNWFYSDVGGRIGWIYGGRYPEPHAGIQPDLRLPAQGYCGGDLGFYATADRIFSFEPARGYIVGWGNKPELLHRNRDLHVPRWGTDRVSTLMAEMDRRIAAVPHTGHGVAAADVLAAYRDVALTDVHFAPFKALFEQLHPTFLPESEEALEALALLRRWDGRRLPERDAATGQDTGFYEGAAIAIFHAWLQALLASVFSPLLPLPDPRGDTAEEARYQATRELFLGTTPARSGTRADQDILPGAKVVLRALQQHYGLRPFDEPLACDLFDGRCGDQVVADVLSAVVEALLRQSGLDEVHRLRLALPARVRSTAEYRGSLERLVQGQGPKPDASGIVSAPATGFIVSHVLTPGNHAEGRHARDHLTAHAQWQLKPLDACPYSPVDHDENHPEPRSAQHDPEPH